MHKRPSAIRHIQYPLVVRKRLIDDVNEWGERYSRVETYIHAPKGWEIVKEVRLCDICNGYWKDITPNE